MAEGAARGEITIVRYADEAILGFECQDEAERYLRELKEHLREYVLELNEDKTGLIRFGRFAAFNRAESGEGKPEAFTFLGLQHI
jgi:RNA-directed DNA polymerase